MLQLRDLNKIWSAHIGDSITVIHIHIYPKISPIIIYKYKEEKDDTIYKGYFLCVFLCLQTRGEAIA